MNNFTHSIKKKLETREMIRSQGTEMSNLKLN